MIWSSCHHVITSSCQIRDCARWTRTVRSIIVIPSSTKPKIGTPVLVSGSGAWVGGAMPAAFTVGAGGVGVSVGDGCGVMVAVAVADAAAVVVALAVGASVVVACATTAWVGALPTIRTVTI